MKRLPRLLALLLALLLFASGCGAKYKTDVDASDASSAAAAAIANGSRLTELNADFIMGSLGLSIDGCDDFSLLLCVTGANIDELGVLRAADEKGAAELAKTVKEYLEQRNRDWMTEYMPEEYPKLRDAECRTFGRYVVYTVLSEADRKAAFGAVEKLLRA